MTREGNVYVGRDEQEVRATHGLAAELALEQDPDVLDTWFSSALWPFSTLGWPEETERLRDFYPTSVLITGFDIIFFWVARMIMMGLKFMGDVPFRDVYIHGLVRDAHGDKMSKSKGNVLDPIDLIDGIELEALVEKRTKGMMQPHLAEKIARQTRKDFPDGIPGFGTDALRFTFAALATTGRDIKFDLGRIEGYRNFCNKLWNASRYVLMNTEGQDCGLGSDPLELSAADRWIRARLAGDHRHRPRGHGRLPLRPGRPGHLRIHLERVLRLVSGTLQAGADRRPTPSTPPAAAPAAPWSRTLETLLRLAHPIMPFITEEIWQKVAPLAGVDGRDHHARPLPRRPTRGDAAGDREVVAEIDWVRQFILGVRRIKGEMNIPPGKPLPVLVANASEQDRRWLDSRPPLSGLPGPHRVHHRAR